MSTIIRVDPLPPRSAVPLAADGASFRLVNHGSGALAQSSWYMIVDGAAIATGIADTVYRALWAMTGTGSPYLAGMQQYGVQSSICASEPLAELLVPLPPEPDYQTLCNIVQPYSTSSIAILVSAMQPRWDGFAYGEEYVAFHTVSPDGFPIIVLVIPPDTAAIGLPDWTPSQVVVSAAGHELFETLTDPTCGGGWYADNGEEGGDYAPCLWHTVPILGTDGATYYPQTYWRNDTNGCFQP